MNGEIINYSNISKDVGISDQTVKSFFQILEDTLVGFTLPPFHRSIRKRQGCVWSQDQVSREIEGVACHHWKTGFSELFNDTRV